jgi:adenosylhomocysteine nucleosidase
MTVVAVTGMAVEARILRRVGLPAIVAAGSQDQRAARIKRAIADGATGLISFGIAGALDPRLVSGDVLLPYAVCFANGEIFSCNDEWREELLSEMPDAKFGSILGETAVVVSAFEKGALFRDTHAVAADLESGLIARAGIPFVVLRVVADSARIGLPPAALIDLDHDGRPKLGAVLRSVATTPGQVPALIRLALDTRRALAALAHAASIMQSRALMKRTFA